VLITDKARAYQRGLQELNKRTAKGERSGGEGSDEKKRVIKRKKKEKKKATKKRDYLPIYP